MPKLVTIIIIILFSAHQIAFVQNIHKTKFQQTLISVYDGESLWGYINGGADVYLEYGFDSLIVKINDYNNEQIKTEIYDMSDSLSAFGIYLISHLKFNKTINLKTGFYYNNNYQIQIAKGSKFIMITNESGSEDALVFCKNEAEQELSEIKETEYKIPDILVNDLTKDNLFNLKICKGPLGIQNCKPDLANEYKFNNDFILYYLPLTYDNSVVTIVLIEFNNETELNKFASNNNIKFNTSFHKNKEKTSSKYYKKAGKRLILIINEYPSTSKCRELINKYFNLTND
jgi:hypothetical protein